MVVSFKRSTDYSSSAAQQSHGTITVLRSEKDVKLGTRKVMIWCVCLV